MQNKTISATTLGYIPVVYNITYLLHSRHAAMLMITVQQITATIIPTITLVFILGHPVIYNESQYVSNISVILLIIEVTKISYGKLLLYNVFVYIYYLL